MKANYLKSLLGSILAFILGTSCCWLTSLAVWLGGATFLTVLAKFVHKYNSIILVIALLFLIVAVYQFYKHQKGKSPLPSPSPKPTAARTNSTKQ